MSIIDFAVLFDLDGVLVDSETEYTRIWNAIDAEFPTGVDGFALKIKGTNLENILSTYYPDAHVRANVEKRLYEEEAGMVYRYCTGARELLTALRESGVPVALYTSSNHLKMEHLYRDIPEIGGYFDAMVLGDGVTHSKPDPEGYLKAAGKLGLPPEKCVVIEDSLQGVKAGRASGAAVIGVTGTVAPEKLAEYSDLIINNMADLSVDKIKKLLH